MQDIADAHHHFFSLLGLLVSLAESDNGVEVDLIGVLKDDLETTLVVVGVSAVLPERDDDFTLRRENEPRRREGAEKGQRSREGAEEQKRSREGGLTLPEPRSCPASVLILCGA